MVRRTQDTNITEKLSMNQDIQWTAFPSPITRMVSFNLKNQLNYWILTRILPHFLLLDNTLDNHGGWVDPGQSHEHGEGPGYGDDEPVLDVAGVGHLLESHPRQTGEIPPGVDGDDGVLHHVLQVGEPVVKILQVNAGPAPGSPHADPVLLPLGAVHLVRVQPDLVGQKFRQLSVAWGELSRSAENLHNLFSFLPSFTSRKTSPAQSLFDLISFIPRLTSSSSSETASNLSSSMQLIYLVTFLVKESKLSRLFRTVSLKNISNYRLWKRSKFTTWSFPGNR